MFIAVCWFAYFTSHILHCGSDIQSVGRSRSFSYCWVSTFIYDSKLCQKMKCTWVILIFPLISWIMASSGEIDYTSFEDCQLNALNESLWALTNFTFKWNNETKILVINGTYNKPLDNNIIYLVHVVMYDCANHTYCDGKPVMWIETINCSAGNLTTDNVNVCNFAQKANKLGKESEEWIIHQYGPLAEKILRNFQFCIDIENIKYELNLDIGSEFDTETFDTGTTSNE